MPEVVKLTTYQLLTQGLVREEARRVLEATTAQAVIVAPVALADAAAAAALAGAKTSVLYQSTQPAGVPAGTIWFNTTVDANGRISYTPKVFNGTAWVAQPGPALLVAAEIAVGSIQSKLSTSDIIQTSDYGILSGSGATEIAATGVKMRSNPTANNNGAWTPLLVGAGGMKVGAFLMDEIQASVLRAVARYGDPGVSTGRVWYRGNVDGTVRGGAPNYASMSVARRRWNTTAQMFSGYIAIIPGAASDNLDSLRYAEVVLYQQAVAGTGTQGTALAWQENASVVLPDRKYQVASNDADTSNIVNADFTIYCPFVTGGYPALTVILHNAFGSSAGTCWYSPAGAADYQTMAGGGTTFPGTWGGTPPAPPAGGGGGGGGGCPAPWVPISVGLPSIATQRYEKPAGEIQVGDFVWTWREVSDGLVQAGGTFNRVSAVSRETNVASRLTLVDGRVLEVSSAHRLFSGGGWVQAQNLLPGAVIDGDRPGVVATVEQLGIIDVVRITVEGAATYQTDGLLSHNMKPGP